MHKSATHEAYKIFKEKLEDKQFQKYQIEQCQYEKEVRRTTVSMKMFLKQELLIEMESI